MKVLTAPKYRHFIPQSPDLTFRIPSLSSDGNNTLLYQYTIHEEHQLTRQVLPQAFWTTHEDNLQVYINGRLQKQGTLSRMVSVGPTGIYNERVIGYTKEGFYLNTNVNYQSSSTHNIWGIIDSWIPIVLNDIVKVVSTESFDGWYHLDIRRLLIQGANPMSMEVLASQQSFQGGYRLGYEIMNGPVYGDVRVCDTHLGWDYKPPAGYRGIDSFSYYLVTEFGQRSEPRCCSIYVG